MRFRLIAPFRCHFNFHNRELLSNEPGCRNFWRALQPQIPELLRPLPLLGGVEFIHAREQPHGMRYHAIHEDGSLLPPEMIRLTPGDAGMEHIREAAKTADAQVFTDSRWRGHLTPDAASFRLRLYDNTVGLAESFLDISAEFQAVLHEHLTAFQDWCNIWFNEINRRFYSEAILPFVLDLWRRDRDGQFIEEPGRYTGFPDVTFDEELTRNFERMPEFAQDAAGQFLWVNRSAFLTRDELMNHREFIHQWVPRLGIDDLGGLLEKDEFVRLDWGNNIFRAEPDSRLAGDAWEALSLCQYFYTVLEGMNLGLTRFVGLASGTLSRRQRDELAKLLEEVVSSVNYLVTQFADTQQNLQSNRQLFLKGLKQTWNMDDLVGNVEKKIGMVAAQINRLNEQSVKSNQYFIQLILFAIGGIALVDFCASLASFARTAAATPDVGAGADGVPGLLDLAGEYPPDSMIWGGLILLLALMGLFWIFQRRGS